MRRLLFVGVMFLFGLLPLSSFGQLQLEVKDQFAKANPAVRFYEQDGTASMIYGKAFSTGATPLRSATNHVRQWESLYGKKIGDLVPQVKPNGKILQGVMPDRDTGIYKFYTFRYDQVYEGVPVFRGGVGFLVRNEANNPLVMTGFSVKEMKGFDVPANAAMQDDVSAVMLDNVWNLMEGGQQSEEDQQPVLDETYSVLKRSSGATRKENILVRASNNIRAAIQQIADVVLAPGIEVSDEKVVIWAGINNVAVAPRMAVSFMAERGSVQTYPDYDKYLIIADVNTGEILLSENQIHAVDVDGTVSGRATDGIGSLECHPETAFFLPYAEVSISGGNTVFADENGDFTIPHGGSTPVTVTSRLRGQWFEVRDQAAGNSIPSISMQVTPPGPVNFLHNPTANQQFPTANVNAYLESNVVRDYVLSYEPTFPVINSQQFFDVNTNLTSTCNAFYNGTSINFYRSGGGCNNTSFSDVVYHEYGHHLVNVTGNGQGQFGEGTGDVIGVLIQDEPILGHGFQGNCSNGIRNADNNHQYPCTGAIHNCGQLISGCVWSTRNELLVTEPNDYRDIGASLFLGMMIVRGNLQPGNSTIDPSITVMYLELDDDDNDLGNGTPHYNEIAAGFGAHNMDAPPLDLLEFVYPDGRPELISPKGGVAFTVQVNDRIEEHESGTARLHVDRGSGFEVFSMNEVSTDVYEANFPPSECATVINYYFSADTTNNNTATDPSDAPDSYFTALSADSTTTQFADDFNSNQGWSVSGNATDGQWNRGVPVGGGDRGDPPTDADGSGSCYLTDNVDGNSDVDGGSTILTSPIIDGTSPNGGVAVLRYSRWYSNNFGNAPEADIFVIDISNNGGSTWTNVETVGPTGTEVRGGWFNKTFKIADFVTPTDQMRVRVIASDLGDGSVIEAGLDGFEILRAHCSDVVTPDSFEVLVGSHNSGDVGDLQSSDDQKIIINSTLRKRKRMMTRFIGEAPNESPGSMKFTVETNTSESSTRQVVDLFNFETGKYEIISSKAITISDSTVVVQLSGDLSRFVESGTRKIEARLRYRSPNVNEVGQFQIGIDQMQWMIGN